MSEALSEFHQMFQKEKEARLWTDLLEAINGGDTGRLARIFKFNPEARDISLDSSSLLERALNVRNEKSLTWLIDHGGCDINQRQNGRFLLHYAIAQPGAEALVECLIKRGADLSQRYVSKMDPDQDADRVRKLRYYSILMGAVGYRSPTVIEMLLKKGVDVDEQDSEGMTALQQACGFGYDECVKVLLAHGATLDLKDNEGRTAQDWAFIRRHFDTAKLIQDEPACREEAYNQRIERAVNAGARNSIPVKRVSVCRKMKP